MSLIISLADHACMAADDSLATHGEFLRQGVYTMG